MRSTLFSLRTLALMVLLGLATLGCDGVLTGNGDPDPDPDPFTIDGEFTLAFMSEWFVPPDAYDQMYVTVDTAAGQLIGPAHWDDPDPHGTTTLSIDASEIEMITATTEAVEFPTLDGQDLLSDYDGILDYYYVTLDLDSGESYHLEWDSSSDVPDELWELETLLDELATRFLG